MNAEPVFYGSEVATAICVRLAMGESLRSICKSKGMPTEGSVRLWVIEDKHGFASRYQQARDIGIDCMADELLDISDESGRDTTTNKHGEEVQNSEWISRSRLRVDTRKWYLSKIVPKKYGDRVEQHHTGDASAPVALVLNGSDVKG